MESNSRIREWIDKISDFLQEQQWFQELKTKWEELDPQSRTYLKFSAFGVGVLAGFVVILSAVWSVHSLKSEMRDKGMLLVTVQNASDEMRRLRDAVPNGGSAAGEGGAWGTYFEQLASTSGVEKANFTLSSEKSGASSDTSKEALFEIGLKHVSIKQVVKYAFSVENGHRPVKLRNLLIDTKGDPTGYMDATLAVSAFTLVNK